MRHRYWPCGGCTHCGRSDKPLTTLSPIKGPGQVKHLCPSCYEAVAEVTWIVDGAWLERRRRESRQKAKEVEVWAP